MLCIFLICVRIGEKMKVIKKTEEGFSERLENVGKKVKKGKIVAFPTDTVYGLGSVPSNENGIKRIYEVKGRPADSPLIVLIGEKEFLGNLVHITGDKVEKLIERFWPGALTIILPKKEWVSDLVTAGGKNLGVRMPDNFIAIDLIKASGGALATPSANKSGQLSPTSAEHVSAQFDEEEIDYLIDGGKTEKAIESTIIDLTREVPMILRNGAITREEIEEVIGPVKELEKKKKADNSFSKKVVILKRKEILKLDKNSLILAFKPIEDRGFEKVEVLSERGDYTEAAKKLFESLHKLLVEDGDVIYVEEMQEKGLGKVIMERIKKIV